LVIIIVDSRFSVAAAFIVAARLLLNRIVAGIVNGLQVAEKVFTAASVSLIQGSAVIASVQTIISGGTFIVGLAQVIC
jgi:hypothetical protein